MFALKNLNRVAHTNYTGLNHGTIKRGCSVKIANDLYQHRFVLFLRIGIEGSHYAAGTQFYGLNQYITDFDSPSGPVAFREAGYVCQQDVGAKTPAINVKELYCPVCSDQQWQYIKSFRLRHLHEPNFSTHCLIDKITGFPGVPLEAIDGGNSIGAKATVQTQQLRPGARSNNPAGAVEHHDLAITGNPIRSDLGFLDLFAFETLDGITPQFSNMHQPI